MKLVSLTMASLALVVAPAYAQTTPTPAETPAAKPKVPAERVICREDNEIGSRIHKQRICMTAAQWRQQGHQQGMDLERRETQRSGSGGG